MSNAFTTQNNFNSEESATVADIAPTPGLSKHCNRLNLNAKNGRCKSWKQLMTLILGY